MIVVDDVAALREHKEQSLCVLASTGDEELAAEASRVLGLAPHESRSEPRRPSVTVVDEQISLVPMVLDQTRTQHILRVRVRAGGLLIIGDDHALEAIVPDLRVDSDDAWTVLVGLVVIVARRCEEGLDEIDDQCQELEAQAIGYASSPQRRTMRRLRAELFRIGQTQAVQRNLLSAEEELAQRLSEDHRQLAEDRQRLAEDRRRLLARAAAAFGANHSMSTQLYAMLGDVLNEQDSVVSERLTLVATIFLPLTLATGFFGMNFQWMLDRLGTMQAFIVFGLVVPSLLTVATLIFIRRLTRSS